MSLSFICHPDRSGGIPFTGKEIPRLRKAKLPFARNDMKY